MSSVQGASAPPTMMDITDITDITTLDKSNLAIYTIDLLDDGIVGRNITNYKVFDDTGILIPLTITREQQQKIKKKMCFTG